MPLDATTGGNSFVTQAEANAYFADSLVSDQWSAVSAKDGALISATEYFNAIGLCSDGSSIEVGGDIPDAIKTATCQLALFMANNLDALDSNDRTKRIKLEGLEIENEISDSEFGYLSSLPSRVELLIKPYICSNSNASTGFELVRY